MALSPDAVRKVAHLARIAIRDADIPAYSQSLTQILELVEQMNAVDTQGVTPMAHSQDLTQRLRPDRITEPEARDALQRGAPAIEAGLYLVPKVID